MDNFLMLLLVQTTCLFFKDGFKILNFPAGVAVGDFPKQVFLVL